MVSEAKRMGISEVIIPYANRNEAKNVTGIRIVGARTLREVVGHLEGKKIVEDEEITNHTAIEECADQLDFSEVKGQEELIEAIVLGAAGGHNILMIGEPGCGKTMIAQRIPSILPEMTEKESLEVTKIYSISGKLPPDHDLMKIRPFRAPHHNVSLNALIGGGTFAMPGEVSLANHGVLFLDELAEFSRSTLDALRQPLEDKKVTISRVSGTNTYPSNFMFVTAMNPCPCGYYGSPKCKCTDYEIMHYRGKNNTVTGTRMFL
jgi:magnesium chelatase family protein